MTEREVYRQFRRSRGFSDYTDAGTNHPDADGNCWWCWKPVRNDMHNYEACHNGMFYTVTHYRRVAAPSCESHDGQQTLGLDG